MTELYKQLVTATRTSELPQGTLTVSVRNLTNKDYQHLYNQVRGYPSTGVPADLLAQGRTISMHYSIDY